MHGTNRGCRSSKRKAGRGGPSVHLWNWLPTSEVLLTRTGISPDTRVKDLTEDEVNSSGDHREGNARRR